MAVLQLSLSLADTDSAFGSSPLSGCMFEWCCVVPPTHFLHRSRCLGVCVSTHSLFFCFVFAHMFGWCELCVDFAPLSVRSLRLLPWRLFRAVLCGSEDSGKGVRRQVCVCVTSVRLLLVMEIAVHHGSCTLVQCRRRSGNLENARAGFVVGPNLVFLELLCVRTVRYLWVTGYGCKFVSVRVSRSCAHPNAVLFFSVQATFQVPSCVCTSAWLFVASSLAMIS